MTVWHRDEFLVRDRIIERDRALRERARVRGLLVDEDLPAAGLGPDRRTLRRALARLLAAVARRALSAARRLDAGIGPEFDLDLEGRRRTASG
mgnify:CR=1 FL=1